jgi:hypothetical protein
MIQVVPRPWFREAAVPTWSILIATLSSRQDKLRRLLDVLLPQAEKDGNTEVVALHNFGERHIGDYRQRLLESARGEYVSYVDDDDMVEDDFVPVVMEAMAGQPDYIAFQHAYYEDGLRCPLPVITGLELGGWYNILLSLDRLGVGSRGYREPGMYRDVTHINPVKASIARQAIFGTWPGRPDDLRYVETIRRVARTQVVIPRVLYHYYHSSADSVQYGLPEQPRIPPLEVDSPAFRWWSA